MRLRQTNSIPAAAAKAGFQHGDRVSDCRRSGTSLAAWHGGASAGGRTRWPIFSTARSYRCSKQQPGFAGRGGLRRDAAAGTPILTLAFDEPWNGASAPGGQYMDRAQEVIFRQFTNRAGLAYPTSPIWAISAFGSSGSRLTIAFITSG